MTMMTPCAACQSSQGEVCCSIADGRCAGQCDKDGHTYESITELQDKLRAEHKDQHDPDETVRHCPICEGDE